MIDAADAVLLVAPEEELGAAMGTVRANQADVAVRLAEGNQLLAEQRR